MNKEGEIYLVQLMPDSLPTRVKVGFSTNITKRMKNFTTICPNARLVASWDADQEKEQAVLTVLSKTYGHIGGEVFEVSNIEGLKDEMSGFITDGKLEFYPSRKLIESPGVLKRLCGEIKKTKGTTPQQKLIRIAILCIWNYIMAEDAFNYNQAQGHLYNHAPHDVRVKLATMGELREWPSDDEVYRELGYCIDLVET